MPDVKIAFDDATDKFVVIVDDKIFADNIATHSEALNYRNVALAQMEIV